MADILKYPVYEDELISFFADAIHDNELKYNCKDLWLLADYSG